MSSLIQNTHIWLSTLKLWFIHQSTCFTLKFIWFCTWCELLQHFASERKVSERFSTFATNFPSLSRAPGLSRRARYSNWWRRTWRVNPSASAGLSYNCSSSKTNVTNCIALDHWSLERTRPSYLLVRYLKIQNSTLNHLGLHQFHWIVLRIHHLQRRNFSSSPGSVKRRRNPTDLRGRMWCPETEESWVFWTEGGGMQKPWCLIPLSSFSSSPVAPIGSWCRSLSILQLKAWNLIER